MGAIAPDLDMFYFYLIDNRQHHHHSYWSHFPITWFSILILSLIYYRTVDQSKKATAVLAIVFSTAGFIHLFLDSIVGDVWWFAPFIDQPYALFTVPAHYHPWWLNFVLHWSFALEVALYLWAGILWHRERQKQT